MSNIDWEIDKLFEGMEDDFVYEPLPDDMYVKKPHIPVKPVKQEIAPPIPQFKPVKQPPKQTKQVSVAPKQEPKADYVEKKNVLVSRDFEKSKSQWIDYPYYVQLTLPQEIAMTILLYLFPDDKKEKVFELKLSDYFKIWGLKPDDSSTNYWFAYNTLLSLNVDYGYKTITIKGEKKQVSDKLIWITEMFPTEDDPIANVKKADMIIHFNDAIFHDSQYYVIKDLKLLMRLSKALGIKDARLSQYLVSLLSFLSFCDGNIEVDNKLLISFDKLVYRLNMIKMQKKRGRPYTENIITKLLDLFKKEKIIHSWICDNNVYKIDRNKNILQRAKIKNRSKKSISII